MYSLEPKGMRRERGRPARLPWPVPIVVLLALLVLLTGCRPNRWLTHVDFDSSDRIMRGAFAGTLSTFERPCPGCSTQLVDVQDIELDVDAVFVDQSSYSVAGTLWLEDGEPLAFTGTVTGGHLEQYFRPQLGVPTPVQFTMEFQDPPWVVSDPPWSVSGSQNVAGSSWLGTSYDEEFTRREMAFARID